jgi:hypothetical protein
MFEPEIKTKWNVLNLGAGVQSSALALMAAKGEIKPMPDFAVFADTQAEPQSVYDWLDWLEGELPFPVYRVTNGDLTESELLPRISKRSGKKYLKNSIPIFGQMPNGEVRAALGRKCTADYKIAPIIKKIKNICGIVRGQKKVTVTQWIGISLDEIQRMKHPKVKWTQHRWPLVEKRISRAACISWMKANGFPEPPRSACYYCPFHSDTEWRRLRDEDPEHFTKAIDFDKKLRLAHKNHNETMDMEVYLHRSCKPLDEIDFDNDEDKGQMTWDFQAECEGMCGI